MNGKELIEEICLKVPHFKELYNARVRHYIIKEHIINVFNEFEKYFSKDFDSDLLEKFRLFLLIHDIGKSLAYIKGNRDNQFNQTVDLIKTNKTELGIEDDTLALFESLLRSHSIGKYMESKLSLDTACDNITQQALTSKLPLSKFFYLLSVYYQCDVASYTGDAGGIPYLEYIFKYENGLKVFNERTKLLEFNPVFDERFSLLSDRVADKAIKDVPNEKEKIESVSTKNINIKVVDKIDLSQFERPLKEIVKNKKNLYIIDTNVFVEYPEIISKIKPEFPIILSAKVIDELDKLKSKLDKSGQQKVQKALRSINKNMDKREITMEIADVSLLSNDFDKRSPDNLILSVALKFKDENPILLTSDNGLQIKAKGLELTTITLKEFLGR